MLLHVSDCGDLVLACDSDIRENPQHHYQSQCSITQACGLHTSYVLVTLQVLLHDVAGSVCSCGLHDRKQHSVKQHAARSSYTYSVFSTIEKS
jgi:hypothetical protein